jgi:uncharacterized phosphosugar-binding protein
MEQFLQIIFNGDGSAIKNIQAGAIVGTVAQANSSFYADEAGLVDAGTVKDSTITGGSINGATLVNVTGTVLNAQNATTANVADYATVAGSIAGGSSFNGTTILNNFVNGTLTFLSEAKIEGDLVVNGTVFANYFNGDGSAIKNIQAGAIVGTVSQANSSFYADEAGLVDAGTVKDSTITGGIINGATLVNVTGTVLNAQNATTANVADYATVAGELAGGSSFNGTTILNNFVNGTLTFLSEAKIEGDLVVNGTVFANYFNGDGSAIKNIQAGAIVGTVAQANSSFYADEAGLVDAGIVKDSTITGGSINGATLVNVTGTVLNAQNATTANVADYATVAGELAGGSSF